MADIKDIKVGNTKYNIKIPSSRVKSMADYAKPSSKPSPEAIQQSDTLNAALGKLEYKADTNQTNILYAINTGVKNALVIKDRESGGAGTIHFSAKDGIVTVTGTNGSNTSFFTVNFTGISGRFKLNGCPSGGSDTTYLQRIYTADGSIAMGIDRGSGTAEFTLDPNVEYQWTIRIQANYAIQNSLVFKPMLYQADTDGSAFQTGALPNSDLTYLEAEDRAALAEEIDAGAKNKLDCNVSTLTPLNTYGSWSGSTYSINSGTTSFVVNSNLTITASKSDTGTARSMTFANYADGSVLNGMVISGGTSNVTIIVQKNGGNYETYATSEGDGALISGIAANTAVRIVASIASAVTCSNVVIKPMLCTKAAFGISKAFVPYRPNYDLVCNSIMKRKSVQYIPHTLTWNQSMYGKYYSADIEVSDISNVYAVTLNHFRGLRDTDIIEPAISQDGTKIRFFSNVNTFTDTSIDEIGVVVIGL